MVRNVETEGAAFFSAANRLMRQLLDYAEMGFPNDDEAVFATPARVMMQVMTDCSCAYSACVHGKHEYVYEKHLKIPQSTLLRINPPESREQASVFYHVNDQWPTAV